MYSCIRNVPPDKTSRTLVLKNGRFIYLPRSQYQMIQCIENVITQGKYIFTLQPKECLNRFAKL